jgi:hypothetical protein
VTRLTASPMQRRPLTRSRSSWPTGTSGDARLWLALATVGVVFTIAMLRWQRGESDFAILLRHDTRYDLSSPPLATIAFRPLALLPFDTAWTVWLGVNLTCLALSIWAIAAALRLTRLETLRMVSILSVSSGALTAWHLGQVTWLMLPFVTAAWIAARASRHLVAGLWLVPTILFKPILGLLVLALPFPAMLVTGLGCGLVLILDLPGWQGWLHAVGLVRWFTQPANASIYGMLARFSSGVVLIDRLMGPLWLVWVASSAVFLGCTAICLRGSAPGAKLTGWLLVTLLVAPLGWVYYLPLIMGPLTDWWRVPRGGLARVGLVLGLGLPYPFLAALSGSALWAQVIWSIPCWSVLFLWLGVIRAERARPTPLAGDRPARSNGPPRDSRRLATPGGTALS